MNNLSNPLPPLHFIISRPLQLSMGVILALQFSCFTVTRLMQTAELSTALKPNFFDNGIENTIILNKPYLDKYLLTYFIFVEF